MAKAKTINDVVEAIEALNTNMQTLLAVELREERTGGIAGTQRIGIFDKIGELGGKLGKAVTAAVGLVKITTRIMQPLDQLQVLSAATGRNIIGIIDQIKDQKFGFIGGIQENAKTQAKAFQKGFDLQDHTLREQLTILDRDAGQGGQLLNYANSLVRQGIPRDVAHEMLKNLSEITLSNTQNAETLTRMLTVMGGITPALTQLGFGDAPQQVLAEISKNLPDLQALDFANVFKDIMTANLGGEMSLWMLGGGKEASEDLKAVLLNIEKTGKATPDEVERVKEIVSRFAKDSIDVQKSIGVGLAGEREAFAPEVFHRIVEGNPMADLATTAKLMGAVNAAAESTRLHEIRLINKESHIMTAAESLRISQESIVHAVELIEELKVRLLRGPLRGVIEKEFGGLFDRINALNLDIQRAGELLPGMADKHGLEVESLDQLWEFLTNLDDPYEPPEEDEDPVTGTTQELQLTALESIQMALGQMVYDAGTSSDGDTEF
jgi:hypothetical protein